LETESYLNQAITSQTYVEDTQTFNQVYVHLDLKGAPPKFEFLERLLRFFATHFKHMVNGILIEFEDMFPFTGLLSEISSPNCYSKSQIR
jgi:hexosaminidase